MTRLFRLAPFQTAIPWGIAVRIAATLLLGPAGSIFASEPGEALSLHTFEESAMGTRFRILLHAPDRAQAEAAAGAAFAEASRLNSLFSDYDPASELMRLTSGTPGVPVPVSPDLFTILDLAQTLATASDGAFDVTLGPLHRLWKQSRHTGRLPPPDKLREAFDRSGSARLLLGPGSTVTPLAAGMRLDLGGIAKGFAADAMLGVLAEAGCPSALVAAGGDVAAGDPPPGEPGWSIGVTSVLSPEQPDAFLILARAAVSTSGDSRQFIEVDGVRYSHILDPSTGLGLTQRLSVTVVADSAVQSDALATCFSVVHPSQVTLPEAFHARAIRIVDESGRQELSGEWQDLSSP